MMEGRIIEVGMHVLGRDFSGQDFVRIQARQVTFMDCNFTDARFSSCNFDFAVFDGCNFNRAFFENTSTVDATFINCSFSGIGGVSNCVGAIEFKAVIK